LGLRSRTGPEFLTEYNTVLLDGHCLSVLPLCMSNSVPRFFTVVDVIALVLLVVVGVVVVVVVLVSMLVVVATVVTVAVWQ